MRNELKYCKYVLGLTILLLSFTNIAVAQNSNWAYKALPSQYKQDSVLSNDFYNSLADSMNTAYDLTNELPVDYDTTGKTDYTSYLQMGINAHRSIKFPNFPVLIDSAGLSFIDSSSVYFQKKSEIILSPTFTGTYNIFFINSLDSINIYFPNIVGDRTTHTGTGGEYGFGINILNSSHVNIFYPVISNCWGDGITINDSSDVPQNINISYASIDNCRRNGISIISANGVIIKKSVISNINGTSPQDGIDIEPNNSLNKLQNIIIDSLVTFNNVFVGLNIALYYNYYMLNRLISVTYNNHKDDGSYIGEYYLFGSVNDGITSPNTKGDVTSNNPILINSINKAIMTNWYGSQVFLNVINLSTNP